MQQARWMIGGLVGVMLMTLAGLGSRAQGLPSFRHESIFGLGPRTIWQGGWGIEVGFDRNRTVREDRWVLEYEVLYGLTVN